MKNARRTAVALILFATMAAAGVRQGTTAVPEVLYDVVITNGRIVDGTGNPWFRADIGIRNSRIVRIGRINPAAAKTIIDAKDRIVAPGFIDVHTHAESIFSLPAAENFVRMGVTTLVTGNCGTSTTDVAEFLGRVAARPTTVNLATLVGHGSVRRRVMNLEDRPPTPDELKLMEGLIERAMKEGALGLSTGLIYVPGTFAKTDEIVNLARVVARHGGLYVTHMRSEGEHVLEAVRESIQIGEQAGLPVDISHFKISSKKLWGQTPATLQLIRDARGRGLSVTVDQYAYTASSTSLDARLPTWVRAGGFEEAKKRLADKETRQRVADEMKESLKRSGFKDYSYAMVASYDADKSFNGKSIVEVTKLVRGKKDLKDQIEQIVTMFESGGAGMVYHGMSEDDVQRIMRESFTMIGSDSGVRQIDESIPHPRGYGNNARVLGRYVRELKIITLEDAIRKMSSLPAQTFGLRDRGILREGFVADVVIFDAATVSDRATFTQPHQYPTGIDYVMVNGQVVLARGAMTGVHPGAAVHGPGASLSSSHKVAQRL